MSSTVTRRRILTGAATVTAGAAAGALAALPCDADRELLDLWAEWQVIDKKLDAHDAAVERAIERLARDPAPIDDGTWRDALAAEGAFSDREIFTRLDAIEERILALPATTPRGAAVKVRLLGRRVDVDPDLRRGVDRDAMLERIETRLLLGALQDLEAMGAHHG